MDTTDTAARIHPGAAPPGTPAGPCLRDTWPMDSHDKAAQPGGADAPSLEASYAQLRVGLLAFLRKHTGDAHVAEDLLHDVVLKALAASADAQTTPRNLTGWLYAVARNAAMDHHRRSRPTEDLADELPAPAPDDDAAAFSALADCLRPVAEQLPATYRDTLIAAEFDGLALAEVARRQGLSLAAVKTRASRGRRLLQARLVDCCRVAVSADGQVLDYDARQVAACAVPPAAGGCAPGGTAPH